MDTTMMLDGSTSLDDLRTALTQGLNHKVGAIVQAALIGGCSKRQLTETAGPVGAGAGREAVRRAIEDSSCIETRRKFQARELGSAPIHNWL
jgi:hypothetical protein